METNKELLEYAAKAAGMTAVWDPQHQAMNLGIVPYNFGNPNLWNPIINDGDAFRLAVMLNLRVRTMDCYATIDVYNNDYTWQSEIEAIGDSPASATRWAIVLAAATIGKREES